MDVLNRKRKSAISRHLCRLLPLFGDSVEDVGDVNQCLEILNLLVGKSLNVGCLLTKLGTICWPCFVSTIYGLPLWEDGFVKPHAEGKLTPKKETLLSLSDWLWLADSSASNGETNPYFFKVIFLTHPHIRAFRWINHSFFVYTCQAVSLSGLFETIGDLLKYCRIIKRSSLFAVRPKILNPSTWRCGDCCRAHVAIEDKIWQKK